MGGMLRYGIPAFRLQKDVIKAEIEILKALGVEFVTGIEVGKDTTIQELRKKNFKAFYVSIGAQKGRKISIEGEDASNVITGVDFLREKTETPSDSNLGKTVVIGGGNVAIDVARTASRLKNDGVQMFCLEERESMPALKDEVHEALEEGVSIHNSYGPKRMLVKNGKAYGIEFMKCIRTFDEDGKFSPLFDADDCITVEADTILLSVGQQIHWGNIFKGMDVKINRNQTIAVDPQTLQSSVKDIFAGGDAATGPKYAIHAIAHGKEAAISIHRFVNRGQSLVYGRNNKAFVAVDRNTVDFNGYDTVSRERVYTAGNENLSFGFTDPRGILTAEQIKTETMRCLSCGISVVDPFLCVGCGACTIRCKFDAIKMEKVYDAVGVDFPKLKPLIIRNVLKRKVRITKKKVLNRILG